MKGKEGRLVGMCLDFWVKYQHAEVVFLPKCHEFLSLLVSCLTMQPTASCATPSEHLVGTISPETPMSSCWWSRWQRFQHGLQVLGLGFLFFFVCEWVPQTRFKGQYQLGHHLTRRRRVRYMHCSREARCLPGTPHIDRAFQLASIPPLVRMRSNITTAPVAVPHWGIERGK